MEQKFISLLRWPSFQAVCNILARFHWRIYAVGGGTLVVTFSEDTCLPDAGTCMYIVFSGSSSRHITQAQWKNHNTLHSIIPGHNAFETVSLTVQTSGSDGGRVIASGEFNYHEDSTHNIARFLANSTHDPNTLNHVNLSDEDLSTLDQRLRLAFENLDLPESWRLIESSEHLVQAPRETLLHFAARHRLTEFALYLLNKPSRELQIALRLPNEHEEIPIDIARGQGLDNLAKEMQNRAVGIHRDLDIDVFCRGPLTARRHRSGKISVSYNLKESYRSIDQQIQMLQEVLNFKRVDDPPQKQVLMHHQQAHSNSMGYGVPLHDENDDEEEEEDDDEDDDEFVECSDRTPTQSSCVLQASMQKLQQITNKVQDYQDINRQELMGQASRRENLSRFSCSCPSLTDKDGTSNSVMKPAVSLRAIASFNEEDEDEDSGESEGCTEANEKNMKNSRGTNNNLVHHMEERRKSVSSGDEEPYVNSTYKSDWAVAASNHRVNNRNQRHSDVSVARRILYSRTENYERVYQQLDKSLGHLAGGQLSDDEFQDAPDRTPSSKSLQSDSNGQAKTDSQKDEMVSDSRSGISNQLVVDGFQDSSAENLDMVNTENVAKVRMRSHLNKDREKRQIRSVSMFEPTMPLTHSTTSRPKPKTIGDHQISKITSEEVPQESDELEADPNYAEFLKTRRRNKARMSLTEFLSDPRNFDEGEETQSVTKRETPKPRPPVFRKFSFLKQKTKKDKKDREEPRLKHQFVPVSFSTSKKCHHCEKSMTNKDALQCQICQVSVHNSSCKDNVVPCTKPSRHPKQKLILRYFGHSLIKPTATEVIKIFLNL
ncbi:rho guanine nucleotide exchange factor 28-like isoform X2 [Anneissia japonica]|uniref:rho guanine nucleotide exchange factor 28-like isoform X2 n=1 Tax=Anneissia japonica TaxID=1529436 RepID=UPI001425BA8C|nr:rho guanine nucleotide exchange factor 28-like isoform X2 [Anneissia japonica]